MTVHKLKLFRPWKWQYWILCSPNSNDILDKASAYWWKRVTCSECKRIGGRG